MQALPACSVRECCRCSGVSACVNSPGEANPQIEGDFRTVKPVRRRVSRTHAVSANPFLAACTPFVRRANEMGPVRTSRRALRPAVAEGAHKCDWRRVPGDRQPENVGLEPRTNAPSRRRRTACVVESMVKPSASDGIYRPTSWPRSLTRSAETAFHRGSARRACSPTVRFPDTLIFLEQLLAAAARHSLVARSVPVSVSDRDDFHVSAYGMYGCASSLRHRLPARRSIFVKYHVLAAPLVTFSFPKASLRDSGRSIPFSIPLSRPAAIRV